MRAYAGGEPLQYLVGETEFMGLPLRTDRRALIPRPETEILVEAVVKRSAEHAGPLRILELGTGCGAISLTHLLPVSTEGGCPVVVVVRDGGEVVAVILPGAGHAASRFAGTLQRSFTSDHRASSGRR